MIERKWVSQDGLMRAGEYDIKIDNLIAEGSCVHGNKDQVIRVSLMVDTSWNDLLQALPLGSIIKDIRRMR